MDSTSKKDGEWLHEASTIILVCGIIGFFVLMILAMYQYSQISFHDQIFTYDGTIPVYIWVYIISAVVVLISSMVTRLFLHGLGSLLIDSSIICSILAQRDSNPTNTDTVRNIEEDIVE